MNISNEKRDAATSQNTRREDKKAANTKVNPIVNFQIGLIAALVAAFLIIELTTEVPLAVNPIATTISIEHGETNMDAVRIIPNNPPKPVVEKAQEPKVKIPKVDPNKPLKVIENDQPDVPEHNKEPVDAMVSNPTETPTAATKTGTNDTPVSKPSGPSIIAALHEVPLFPGCSSRMDSKERIECLNKKMGRFIQRKFDTSLGNDLNEDGMVKIAVQFTIGVDGLPKDILVKAPNKDLEEEAYNVISRLPKMTPGKIDNAAVNVTYALPIRFQLRD
ncbi:energy transducer TonB [uncultured Nonlabens sp.]|uniref:energy transducer TonB n=1 Tax=uncultured Nonlabens sp. TaxID=859306 RepID=UPI002637502E|nr:energy transducer TonB [uncultured Nonlabens sp.]